MSQQTQQLNNSFDENNKQRAAINRERQETQNLNSVKERVFFEIDKIVADAGHEETEIKKMQDLNIFAQDEVDSLRHQIRKERESNRNDIQQMKMEVLYADRRQKEQEISTNREMNASGGEASTTLRHELKITDEEKSFNEPDMRSHILRASIQNAVNANGIRELEIRTHLLDNAMVTIQQSTGIQDTDAIVQGFIEYEKQNFSALTYHTELQKEVALLTARSRELVEALEGHKLTDDDDQQRKAEALAGLNVQIDEAKRNLEVKEKELWYSEAFLADVQPVLKTVCEKLETSWVEGSKPPSYLTTTQAFNEFVEGDDILGDGGNNIDNIGRQVNGDSVQDMKQDSEQEVFMGVNSGEFPAESRPNSAGTSYKGAFQLSTSRSKSNMKHLAGRPTREMLAPGPNRLAADNNTSGENGSAPDLIPLIRFCERYVLAHKNLSEDLVDVNVDCRPSSSPQSHPVGTGVLRATDLHRKALLNEHNVDRRKNIQNSNDDGLKEKPEISPSIREQALERLIQAQLVQHHEVRETLRSRSMKIDRQWYDDQMHNNEHDDVLHSTIETSFDAFVDNTDSFKNDFNTQDNAEAIAAVAALSSVETPQKTKPPLPVVEVQEKNIEKEDLQQVSPVPPIETVQEKTNLVETAEQLNVEVEPTNVDIAHSVKEDTPERNISRQISSEQAAIESNLINPLFEVPPVEAASNDEVEMKKQEAEINIENQTDKQKTEAVDEVTEELATQEKTDQIIAPPATTDDSVSSKIDTNNENKLESDTQEAPTLKIEEPVVSDTATVTSPQEVVKNTSEVIAAE